MNNDKKETARPIFVNAALATPVSELPKRRHYEAPLFAPAEQSPKKVVWKRLEGAPQMEDAAEMIGNPPAPKTPAL